MLVGGKKIEEPIDKQGRLSSVSINFECRASSRIGLPRKGFASGSILKGPTYIHQMFGLRPIILRYGCCKLALLRHRKKPDPAIHTLKNCVLRIRRGLEGCILNE